MLVILLKLCSKSVSNLFKRQQYINVVECNVFVFCIFVDHLFTHAKCFLYSRYLIKKVGSYHLNLAITVGNNHGDFQQPVEESYHFQLKLIMMSM
jgi:hypothetical protein